MMGKVGNRCRDRAEDGRGVHRGYLGGAEGSAGAPEPAGVVGRGNKDKGQEDDRVYVLAGAARKCLPTGPSLGGTTEAKAGWMREKRGEERPETMEQHCLKRRRRKDTAGRVVIEGTSGRRCGARLP